MMGFRQKLVMEAKTPPIGEPQVDDQKHTNGNALGYICNMAVLYWGFCAFGLSRKSASKLVADIIRAECDGCLGRSHGAHLTTARAAYVADFLDGNKEMSFDQLRLWAKPGDILILGPIKEPPHSVVVIENDFGEIKVRGWNNAATFAAPEECAAALMDMKMAEAKRSAKQAPSGGGGGGGGGTSSYSKPAQTYQPPTPLTKGEGETEYKRSPYMRHDYVARTFEEIVPDHRIMPWYLLDGDEFWLNIAAYLNKLTVTQRLANLATTSNGNNLNNLASAGTSYSYVGRFLSGRD